MAAVITRAGTVRVATGAFVAVYWCLGLVLSIAGGLPGVLACLVIDRALSSITRDAGAILEVADEFEEVECSMDDHCTLCTGEACELCGAGCWRHVYGPGGTLEDPCEHDVAERHTRRKVAR